MNMYKVPEVAARLSCSASFIYEVIATKELSHYRLGKGQGGIRVSEKQLQEFLARRERSDQLASAIPAATSRRKVKLKHLDV